MKTASLARVLGEHYSALKLEQVPPAVVEKGRLVILDALANAIEGWDTPVSREARALTGMFANPGQKPTVWADGIHASPLDAVFANATLVHSLLHDDSLPGTSTHGASMIIPSAMAMAEQEGASGARVLLAVIVAYDVQGRLGCMYKVAGPVVKKGHRGSPMFGPIVSAAAASVVLGLDGERFASAINLAANFSGGLLECQERGTSEYRYQNANAARAGVCAALLARMGTPVAETTLDGEFGFLKVYADLDAAPPEITSELGDRYEILRVLRKPYPTCGNNIRIARTLEQSFRQRGLKSEDIAAVSLRVHPQSLHYPGCNYPGPFNTLAQALMSTQFAVASIVRHGRLNASSYSDIGDPALAEVAGRVELIEDASVRVGLYECKAEVRLRNGDAIAVDASPDDDGMFNPGRQEAVQAFHDMTAHAMPESQRKQIVDAVLQLELLQEVAPLIARLVLSRPGLQSAA